MNSIRNSLLAVAFAALATPVAAQNGDLATRVDAMFADFNRPGSPGLAVAVVKDGRIILERGYGHANLEHGVRITPSTVFDIASVSKQFAGLSIAMLVDQGRINLKDDIRKYIPELQDVGQTITIDHLLHHTSGIRDWPQTLSIAGWRYDDVISFDQILRFAYNQRTLNFTPGAEYTYSNTGYNLLAETVARVTGKSFRQWTDENLFRPLGMSSTHFHDDHGMVVQNRAYGYTRSGDGFRVVTNNLTALGSSSLFSTVGDLARWVANFDDAKVGGRKAMELFRTRGVLNDGSPNSYAFGIGHGEYRGIPHLSHSGGWAAFNTFLIYFPAQRTGIITLANSPVANSGRAAFNIADIVLEASLGSRSPDRPAMATAPAVDVPETIMDRYVGLYRLGPAWYVRIRRDGRTLRSQATREPEAALSPRTSEAFWVDAYNASMAFQRDSATNAIALFYRGRRIPKITAPEQRTPLTDLAGEYESDELQTKYIVEVKDTTVTLRHRRHGTITLTRAWGDDYAGSVGFMGSVEFQRDSSGRVTGFVVNAGERVRNVVFVKRR
jgi:CubicO group peptidase (beta-lactamase class C family)